MIRINSKIKKSETYTGVMFDKLTVLGIDMEKSSEKAGGVHVLVKCICGLEFSKSLSDILYHEKNNYSNRCYNCFINNRRKGGRFLQWHWYNTVMQNAKTRNIILEIDIEYCEKLWDIQNGICALSGVIMAPPVRTSCKKTSNGKKTTRYEGDASLDRIDSSKGYVEGNVQWVHKSVNKMKMSMTDEELVSWCTKISNHSK
jgi:hypothetical protein